MPVNNTAPFIQNPFLLYPQHEEFLQGGKGHIKQRSSGEVTLAIGFFLLVIIPMTLGTVAFAAEVRMRERLEQDGITTTGMIVDQRTKTEKSTSYFVTYEFTVESANGYPITYRQEEAVSKAIYDQGINVPIAVRFLPENPNVSDIRNRKPDYMAVGIFMLLFPVMLALPFAFLAEYVYKKWLERSGKVIIGTLRDYTVQESRGYYSIQTQYAFQSPSGLTINGKQTDGGNDLKNRPLMVRGTSIAVLYVNRFIYRML